MKTTISRNCVVDSRTWLRSLLIAAVAAAAAAAQVDVEAWPAATYDRDGDGYAPVGAASSARVTVSCADHLICPPGYVTKRGDFDDSDPMVHPRRMEVFGNGIDDNCNGAVDEPLIRAYPSANANTASGFSLRVVIMSASARTTWMQSLLPLSATRLGYRIQVQALTDTATSTYRSGSLAPSAAAFAIAPETTLRVDGLAAATVYRARVRFERVVGGTRTPIGTWSDFYYTMTDGTDRLTAARQRLVHQALYQYYLCEQLGHVGYRGTSQIDGTRYTAAPGEQWCSEFYSWVGAASGMAGIYGKRNVSQLTNYFMGHYAYLPASSLGRLWAPWLQVAALPGDYIRKSGHSAMFLAFDHSNGTILTVDGNNDRQMPGGGRRYGGNETVIQRRDPGDFVGLGRLRAVQFGL